MLEFFVFTKEQKMIADDVLSKGAETNSNKHRSCNIFGLRNEPSRIINDYFMEKFCQI